MAVPPKLSETIMSLAARTCTDAIDATRRIARIDAVETGVAGGDEVVDDDEDDMEDEVEDEVEEQASRDGARGAAGRNCFLRIAMSGSASRSSSASVMPRS